MLSVKTLIPNSGNESLIGLNDSSEVLGIYL